MNTIIFHAFRAATVLGVALFAFVGNVFAAPVLTPATANQITENSANIIGHVSNPQKNSTVWFEIFNPSGTTNSVAVQGIWNEGTFQWYLNGLEKGKTYSFRSAAMENGVTVYSPTASFTTVEAKQVAAPVIPVVTTAGSQTSAIKGSQTASTQTAATKQSTIVKNNTAAVATTTEGFANNGASIIGAGNSMLPNTLIGWILLLIVTLIAVLLAHMIYDSVEKRKIAREKKELEEKMKKEIE